MKLVSAIVIVLRGIDLKRELALGENWFFMIFCNQSLAKNIDFSYPLKKQDENIANFLILNSPTHAQMRPDGSELQEIAKLKRPGDIIQGVRKWGE